MEHPTPDHGEWLSFHLPMGVNLVPVRITRAAMEQHFGAQDFPNLTETYRHHAEHIERRVAHLAREGVAYSAHSPLVVDARDLM